MPLLKKPVRLSLWQRRGTKAVIHIIAIGYLAWLFFAGLSDKLGPDPVEVLINETGIWAIHFLLLTLSLSPLSKNLPSAEPMHFRRLIGVYTFVYALSHLLTYIAFELQFDMALVASEIISRPYIVVGMTALVLLFMLTATSFKKLQRKMGRSWKRLHNTIYVILPLALLHFSWSQKTFWQEPVWYWLLGLLIMSPRIKTWTQKVRANRNGSA